MLLLLLMLLTATQSPPPGPQGIVTADDYPPVAVANGWEGDVAADLTIDSTGRVAACTVTQSSGHKLLDDTTCNLLIARARLLPAKDANGNPVASHFRTPVFHWRLGR